MPDPRDPPEGPSGPPRYRRHRARPGFLGGAAGREDDMQALRALRARQEGRPARAQAPADLRDADGRVVHGRGRRGIGLPRPRLPGRRARRALTAGLVLRRLLKAAIAWLLIALGAFAVSATIHQSGDGGDALGGGGVPPFGATNILVLGSDARPKNSREPGADPGGPSRSDTMLLLRVGAGHNARLSIPRDTVVAIPGHGRTKINAAYAFGGAALAVKTVEAYLGIDVNHLIEVNFQNFPDLIDAMGGVDYTGGCVVSRISGGARNGGTTLRLRRGTTRLDGRQALALARTRHNACNPRENDFTRARRQQKLLSAMRSRVLGLSGFLHGPFIGWNVPQAIRTDMSAPTLLGVFAALASSGNATPRVLRTTPLALADGSAGLVAGDATRRAAVRRFLAG